MKFEFLVDDLQPIMVKKFVKKQDISRNLLAKIKYRGGDIRVNQEAAIATTILYKGDRLTIEIPDEIGHDTLVPMPFHLDIVYEDDHFLVINKPVGIPSIPSALHNNTIANYVKHYYLQQGYPNERIHIVTRLDKDTSGLMLLAKHGYAHARLDKQLQKKEIQKRYFALVKNSDNLKEKADIIAPIGRSEDSIITRRVHSDGKYAHTSYRILERRLLYSLVDVSLHTGRTHQIRVHFSHLLAPLLGDDLYGGSLDFGISRQALHCHYLQFYNPFSKETVVLTSQLPADFLEVMSHF